jgi:uncharacterized protein YfaP (DUF2135 family)
MAIDATVKDGKGNELHLTGTPEKPHYEVKVDGKTTYSGNDANAAKAAKKTNEEHRP